MARSISFTCGSGAMSTTCGEHLRPGKTSRLQNAFARVEACSGSPFSITSSSPLTGTSPSRNVTGLDPFWWTPDERSRGWTPWQDRRARSGHCASSLGTGCRPLRQPPSWPSRRWSRRCSRHRPRPSFLSLPHRPHPSHRFTKTSARELPALKLLAGRPVVAELVGGGSAWRSCCLKAGLRRVISRLHHHYAQRNTRVPTCLA